MLQSARDQISTNERRVDELVELLRGTDIPVEDEGGPMSRISNLTARERADAYFAIVAICHQTSPLGERRLEGYISEDPHSKREGWDYLKGRFLLHALQNRKLTSPSGWSRLTPIELSDLYDDTVYGRTLTRVNERTHLLNDLGARLLEMGFQHIEELYLACGAKLGGEGGFLARLHAFEAYRDPVQKKSLYFASIVATECGWHISDPENLLSPIDYHELRGHLRIGTVLIEGALHDKIRTGLPLSADEDTALRSVVQGINERVASQLGISSSRLHYLLWNVFRNCCPRQAAETHCDSCGDSCKLPESYKAIPLYQGRCIFSSICVSARQIDKVVDPPYVGDFY